MIEMQLLEQDMQQLQQNIQNIDQHLMEINMIKRSLDDFSEIKKDSEGLMPIANGIFAKAKISDSRELLVNVGANVVVKKSIPDTKKLMDEQTEELKKYRENLMQQMNEVIFKIQELQDFFQNIKE